MVRPLRFAFCTAFHLAVCSGVGFLGGGLTGLRTLLAPVHHVGKLIAVAGPKARDYSTKVPDDYGKLGQMSIPRSYV